MYRVAHRPIFQVVSVPNEKASQILNLEREDLSDERKMRRSPLTEKNRREPGKRMSGLMYTSAITQNLFLYLAIQRLIQKKKKKNGILITEWNRKNSTEIILTLFSSLGNCKKHQISQKIIQKLLIYRTLSLKSLIMYKGYHKNNQFNNICVDI